MKKSKTAINSEPKSTTQRDYSDVQQADKQHVWHHITQHSAFDSKPPLMMVQAQGMHVTDSNGNDYIDATSGGVWTVNVGYGRDDIVDAISNQLRKIPYFGAALATAPGAQCAQKLTELLPHLDRIYYSNSGSEANEKAYKIVRQLSHFESRKGKRKIIYRERDYHGTTLGALSSGGHDERNAQYGPLLEDFVRMPHCCCYRCPFNKTYGECNIECAQALETVIQEQGPETVGAVILEPITAGGGIIVPVPEYFPIIQKICQQYDVLLILDEVVTGMGRTGNWFGFQHYAIEPDMITLAKGLASGYAAISVLATTAKIFEQFKADTSDKLHYFRDISTFGGCTAGPAAVVANIDIIQRENLIDNAATIGAYFIDKLTALYDKHQIIGDIRGKGLLIGIELVEDRQSKQPVSETVMTKVYLHCLQGGVIIGRSNRSIPCNNNVILLCPPLICSKSDADIIVNTIDHALEKISAN